MKNRLDTYFKNCLYFTSGQLYRQVEQMAFLCFSPLGIAPTQAFIIMALAEAKKRSLSPSDLAELIQLDRSTVTRLLQGLEKEKLISRGKVGRSVEIKLTPAGKALVPKIEEAWSDLYDLYSKKWGEKKSKVLNGQLYDFLRKESHD